MSHWVHVPWINCASPSPSHEEGVALLVARTCNEIVPAHKEFLRARQTPVPLICMVCRVLECTVVPEVPGMLHLEREARDGSTYNEYSYRTILLLLPYIYCSRAHPHFPSQFRGVASRILFSASANTPKTGWEGNLLFLAEGK